MSSDQEREMPHGYESRDRFACDRCGAPATTEIVIERVVRSPASIGRSGVRREQFERLACDECADRAEQDKALFLVETRAGADARGVA
jgi:hypothetical protein